MPYNPMPVEFINPNSGFQLYSWLLKQGYSCDIALETCIEMGMDFRPKPPPAPPKHNTILEKLDKHTKMLIE
jgi:hypothetical protein